MPPVFTRDQVAATERPPEIGTDRMAPRPACGCARAHSRLRVVLIFKYSAARRLRRREILDQRGSAWKWTEPSHTFSASEVSIRQANIVCDLLEPRELSCATEELRQLLVQLVESDTFSRWLPISRHDVDPSFSYSPGGASGSLGRSKSAVRSATSTCSAKGESVKGVRRAPEH
jgi:hypothetical protein